MQAQQPISSDVQANTESSIKRYKVSEPFSDFEVTLEVDHNVLTPAMAQQINQFWMNHEDRAEAEDGDHVRAVIRMAGSLVVGLMLESGWAGASFGTNNTDQGQRWSEKFRDEEGWGSENDTPYGRCGIRVVGASVSHPGFDEFEVEDMT